MSHMAKRAMALFPALLVLPSVSAWAYEWDIESLGNYCQPSLALDDTGRAHTCVSTLDYKVKYAVQAGPAWAVRDVGSGDYPSLALDSSGNPHIAYRAPFGGALKYSAWDGTQWRTQTVTSGWVGAPSLVLDSLDRPRICYDTQRGGGPGIVYASRDGTSWSFEVVFAGMSYAAPSLALDSQEKPHVSYQSYANVNLNYASRQGSSWSSETVDDYGTVGCDSSLVISSGGTPHISYHDESNQAIKYASFDGASWTTTSIAVVGVPSVDAGSSIALKGNGNPCVAYNTQSGLRYAELSSGSWRTEAVALGTGWTGLDPSLSISLNDLPCIAYWDAESMHLMFAKAVPGPALAVGIDIKPGSDPNPINLKSQGVVPVAILGSEFFDVNDVDQGSLRFEGSAARERGHSGAAGTFIDINADSYLDLIVHFPTPDIDTLGGEDLYGELTGMTTAGMAIVGTDLVKIIDKADANLDGTVDMLDLTLLANSFGASGATWWEGDFTGEGDVNVFDLTMLANDFGRSTPDVTAPIPEPATLSLLGLGGLALIRRSGSRKP